MAESSLMITRPEVEVEEAQPPRTAANARIRIRLRIAEFPKK